MSAEILTSREKLRVEVSGIADIFTDDPENWWLRSYLYLRRQLKKMDSYPSEIKDPLAHFLDLATDLVRHEADVNLGLLYSTERSTQIAQRAEAVIMKVSYEMAKRFEPKIDKVQEHIIPVPEILKTHGGNFRLDGENFGIKYSGTSDYYFIKLPSENRIWYKGGVSRLILNIIAGADKSIILSDLPPNDHDGIAVGGQTYAHAEAEKMGIDADGLETWKGDSLDFARFCLGRDSTQNQVIFGKDGLHYSNAAFEAAQSGYTKIVGKYIPEKAIYGVDLVYIKGIELVKPRGQMRLIKALSEGKIQSFEHKPLSNSLDVGLYVMFLAKRWSKKENFPELLQKMFEVLKKMGHVREGENKIFDVLKRAHKDYPFFDFRSEIKDIVEVVGWKSRKLVKQIDREFAWINKESPTLSLERTPNDTVSKLITLEGFHADPGEHDSMLKKWKKYLVYASKEYDDYKKLNLTPVERLFMKADQVDFEEIGLGQSESGVFMDGEEEI